MRHGSTFKGWGVCITFPVNFFKNEPVVADDRRDEFAAILETALDCIIIMDAEGRVREFNPAAERTFGYVRAEVVGAVLADKIIPPAMREAHHRGLAHYRQSGIGPLLGHRVEVSAMRADGSEFPCELTITAIRTGPHPLFIAYLRDLTERAHAEAAFRELNADLERQVAERTAEVTRFATVSRLTRDFFGIADMNQRVLYINPAGREMLGWGPQGSDEGRTVREVYTEWAYQIITEETIPKALAEGVWTGDLAVQHVDGHEVPVSMVGVIVRSEDGQPEFMSAIMRDTRERVEIERKLEENLARERELGRLKSSFVSMVSHEFRTPLGIILSSSEILIHYLDRLEPAARGNHLNAIRESVNRMSELMEQVLMFSRSESGQLDCRPQPLELAGFCQRLQDELGSATNQRCPIEFGAETSLDGAMGDEKLLRPVFTNLLTNAVKYSTPGTLVRFTARREGCDAIFQIVDRGIGIPAVDFGQLFTAFRRARNVADVPGTGLGLVIVRKCLEAHGGEIRFESVENEGTTAHVTIPLFPDTSAPAP